MDKVIARLVILDAAEMTYEGRNDIARWLRRQSDLLRREGDNYAEKFTARFLVPDRDETSSKVRTAARAPQAPRSQG